MRIPTYELKITYSCRCTGSYKSSATHQNTFEIKICENICVQSQVGAQRNGTDESETLLINEGGGRREV
jgi:hypothetical protein